MAAVAVLLTATSTRYGYHRDELYFRMLKPAWGYVDQPPFTPLVARLFSHLADAAWAVRIPATAATVVSIYVLALITRELGGSRRAQALCAWGYGLASLPLIMGHALLTSTLDFPVWPAIALCIIRALLRREPRWWIAAGVIAGLSTYNKLLVAILLLSLGAGLLIAGPRRALVSRHVLAAVALMTVLALPNIVYQAMHGWPELSVGRALRQDNGTSVRVLEIPFLFLILGPPLVPIWVAGIVGLWRRPEWRALRFLVPSFAVLLVVVFVMASQFYYPFGLLAVLFAIGCAAVERWLHGVRARWLVAGVALNAAVSIALALPIFPLSVLGKTPFPGINQVERDTIGWPAYVREIAAVYKRIPPAEQRRTVILASNYGEAGAVARYGPRAGLPPVYSGHNALYGGGPPPARATTAVVVGGQVADASSLFASCRTMGKLDDRVGVDNEEQGEPVAVCARPLGGWRAVWPELHHYG